MIVNRRKDQRANLYPLRKHRERDLWPFIKLTRYPRQQFEALSELRDPRGPRPHVHRFALAVFDQSLGFRDQRFDTS